MEANLEANFAGKIIPARAELSYYNQGEAMSKAAATLGICWVVGLVCIFVPVLHFVLVPLAILAGPIAGTMVYFKTQKLPKVVDGTVSCGHCQAATTFHFEKMKPPFYDSCKSCKTGYEIIWPPKSSP